MARAKSLERSAGRDLRARVELGRRLSERVIVKRPAGARATPRFSDADGAVPFDVENETGASLSEARGAGTTWEE